MNMEPYEAPCLILCAIFLILCFFDIAKDKKITIFIQIKFAFTFIILMTFSAIYLYVDFILLDFKMLSNVSYIYQNQLQICALFLLPILASIFFVIAIFVFLVIGDSMLSIKKENISISRMPISKISLYFSWLMISIFIILISIKMYLMFGYFEREINSFINGPDAFTSDMNIYLQNQPNWNIEALRDGLASLSSAFDLVKVIIRFIFSVFVIRIICYTPKKIERDIKRTIYKIANIKQNIVKKKLKHKIHKNKTINN